MSAQKELLENDFIELKNELKREQNEWFNRHNIELDQLRQMYSLIPKQQAIIEAQRNELDALKKSNEKLFQKIVNIEERMETKEEHQKDIKKLENNLKTKDSKLEPLSPTEVSELKTQLNLIGIPIGFIYIQLPKEKSPKNIWPGMIWTDISAEYAGVFFRVSGGNAAPFGAMQEESTPRLTSIQTQYYSDHVNDDRIMGTVNMIKGDWSKWVGTGFKYSFQESDVIDLRFMVSNDEVRPKNMAIHIWKRIG